MSEERFKELTEKHDHAIERLEEYEVRQRATRKWLMTAVLTAVGGLGGTGGLAYLDGAGDDAVATHIAMSEQRAEIADANIEKLMDQQRELKEMLIRLQVNVENLR